VNPLLVVGVWVLVTLDCALMGLRLALGRSALLDKRRALQWATVRAGLLGQVPLAVVTAVAVSLVGRGGADTAAAFDDAMVRFCGIGGAYAAAILATSALCLLPSVAVRSAASVIIFGPLTLLRPAVVVATVGGALGTDPPAELLVVGLLVAVPGVAIEPVLDRRAAARGPLAPLPVPGRRAAREPR
jgi:hypothetical protein